MKRIIASVGMVALGAASVQAQSAISGPAPKWWSVSATVRGFYDDNANTSPNGTPKTSTFGYDLSPSVTISIGNDQTTFTASYIYNYIYYGKALVSTTSNSVTGQTTQSDKSDMDHTFNMALDHQFNERYNIHVGDAFVIGQQPDAIRAGNEVTAFFRIPGDNIVNSGSILFNAELTPLWGIQAGYNNAFYDYKAAELSGPLNRIENTAHIDGRYHIAPETVLVAGYQFGYDVYTGSGPFAQLPTQTGSVDVKVRDTLSHTLYVGADHTFLPELVGSVRAGASYYDYYNDPNSTTAWGPYTLASLAYTYAPESSLEVGFQEGRNASGLVSGFSVIQDTETSVIYMALVHRIIPKLFGTVRGTFQNSIYEGGGPGVDGKADQFYEAEVDFEYRFTPHFSAHAGYDYDRLDSGVSQAIFGPRNYDRNKVYIGATATY